MKRIACIGSGPSLTRQDCALLARTCQFVIAVNESWRMAPEAGAVYAGDCGWWDEHAQEVPRHMVRWTCMLGASTRHGINLHRVPPGQAFNSGQRAIELAIWMGATQVVLLGYDCSIERGKHWHADHKGGELCNPNAQRIEQWQAQFAAIDTKGIEVINCSRETDLRAFPRMALEELCCAAY